MKLIKTAAEWLHKISNVGVWIAGFALFGIAAFIFVDVFARYLFNNAITGSQEIVELTIVIVLYFGLPYSTYKRSHVRVDALTSKFPPAVKDVCLGVMDLLCAILCAVIVYQLSRQTGVVLKRGNASAILHIPHWPFYIAAIVGNFFLTFEFLADGIRYFAEAVEHGKKKENPVIEEGNV